MFLKLNIQYLNNYWICKAELTSGKQSTLCKAIQFVALVFPLLDYV